MPKISIIIPIYNTKNFLVQCLDSVCAQTLKDIEIICIDDCSTDGSAKILDSYAASDYRVKVIHFSKNMGAGAARNAGLSQAKGEYIGFVDSDDFLDLNFYEELYSTAATHNADIAKGNIKIVNIDNMNISENEIFDLNSNIQKHKAYFYWSFTTGLYSRKIINDYKINFLEGAKNFEDPYFSIKIAAHANKVAICNLVTYYYVNRPHSNSKDMNVSALEDLILCMNKIFIHLNNLHLDKLHKKIIFSFFYKELTKILNSEKSSFKMLEITSKALMELINHISNPEEYFYFHYLEQRKKHMLKQANSIRLSMKSKDNV